MVCGVGRGRFSCVVLVLVLTWFCCLCVSQLFILPSEEPKTKLRIFQNGIVDAVGGLYCGSFASLKYEWMDPSAMPV